MNEKQLSFYTTVNSPLGELLLQGDEDTLTGLFILKQKHAPAVSRSWQRSDHCFENIRMQLKDFFQGVRQEFDLKSRLEGTDFQMRVWNELKRIPYGHTRSYGELAAQIGNANASRAVGLANGRNPISIIIPCHRVIGANGSLTGYGGGLDAKRWLLEHEQKHFRTTAFAIPLGA